MERHIGRIAEPIAGSTEVEVDVGALVRRLILFDQSIVETIRLKELPLLISMFGTEGILELLETGALRLLAGMMTAGQIGQSLGLQVTVRRGGILPLGAYRLASVTLARRKDFLHQVLQEVHKAPITHREAIRFKRAIAPRLLDYPDAVANAGIADANDDLVRQHPIIWEGIRAAALEGKYPDPGSRPAWSIDEVGEAEFRLTADLPGVPPGQISHDLVERGLLLVAGLNQRIELMDHFDAITGFQDEEIGLFERRLAFAWAGRTLPARNAGSTGFCASRGCRASTISPRTRTSTRERSSASDPIPRSWNCANGSETWTPRMRTSAQSSLGSTRRSVDLPTAAAGRPCDSWSQTS